MNELWVRVERRDHRLFISTLERVHQTCRHRRICDDNGRPRTLPLFLSDDGDDVGVATFGGNRESACRVAVRVDALPRVGTVLHQEADHVRPLLQHSMMKGAALVVSRHIEVDELGTYREHRLHAVDVTSAHGVAESADRCAIDERLQFWPAVEAVGTREHELSVVQREARAVRSLVVSVDLRHSVRVAGHIGLQQFLRLALELDEIGFVAQRAGGSVFA